MQVGEPKPFAGLLNEREGVLKRGFGARHIARHQQGFGKARYIEGVPNTCAGRAQSVDRSAQRRDIFLRWLARRVDASKIDDAM
jgi:hypothetical protein